MHPDVLINLPEVAHDRVSGFLVELRRRHGHRHVPVGGLVVLLRLLGRFIRLLARNSIAATLTKLSAPLELVSYKGLSDKEARR